jgi:glyoxylase-like metal-dependent hydrolase (beta-lactamase superfamily II)
MSMTLDAPTMRFPHPAPPPTDGVPVEIAPGVLWLRVALPFALNHVNIYLIEDGAGWAILDTGLADERTMELWTHVFDTQLQGRKPTKLIVTHSHPDHVGLAGWLCARHDIELWMSQVEFLQAQNLRYNPAAIGRGHHRDFYVQHGLEESAIDSVLTRGHSYIRMTTEMPAAFNRLIPGRTMKIGGRMFEIMTGEGHSNEQVMLLCRDEALFFAADQVLAKISPNIGVWPWEPKADPLGAYLASLAKLRAEIDDNVFVLAAHNLPFYGLHTRIEQLMAHHEARCGDIIRGCAARPITVAEVLPVMFNRPLDAHQTGFAFGEALAHVNYLAATGDLTFTRDQDGVMRMAQAG